MYRITAGSKDTRRTRGGGEEILMKRLLIRIPALAFLAPAATTWAIGGVDTVPAPSERHETKFATPQETRLENGLRVIVAARPGLPLPAAPVLVRSEDTTTPVAESELMTRHLPRSQLRVVPGGGHYAASDHP